VYVDTETQERKFHLVSVVGARPQFVKLGPIHHECVRRGIRHSVIHTGQHYDPVMSDVFFSELEISPPSINLGTGSGTHAAQIGRMIERMDAELDALSPDVVLVYGDTNSTLAAAVVVGKRVEPLVHLEAGLRSFNRAMPEEINRILVDHSSDLLLAPTENAMSHLRAEGLEDRSVLVGDVMVDALKFAQKSVAEEAPQMPQGWVSNNEYVLATIHRAHNTDSGDRLSYLIQRLRNYPIEVRLAVHPRLEQRLNDFGIELDGAIRQFAPLSYRQTVHAIINSLGVVTDSGGLQKEAAILEKPCITVREESEWTESIDAGWNTLDPNLFLDPCEWIDKSRPTSCNHLYGDGRTASRVVDAIVQLRG
jgi:UDP-N-acetylglucosamine 2-epimerase (non-hydrolysing)